MGGTAARGWVRDIDIWTATTEDTATTAWIKGLRVLSLSSVTVTTEDKTFRVSAGTFGPASHWCLVPDIAGIFSAAKAPTPPA